MSPDKFPRRTPLSQRTALSRSSLAIYFVLEALSLTGCVLAFHYLHVTNPLAEVPFVAIATGVAVTVARWAARGR
jgi:hypothetical protein